jgi:hypothetical protein
MVGVEEFESTTLGLKDRCSNQLSYTPIKELGKSVSVCCENFILHGIAVPCAA